MKQIIDLRPVYHRREDRIRAHVLLCWLALLLIRVAETAAGEPWTWNRIRAELQRLHAVTWTGPGRHLPPGHRAVQAPARHPRRAQPRPAEEDHPDHPGPLDALTSRFPSA